MADPVVAVVDTNVFLNLATPVVDSRPTAPTGADPLKALLVSYDVHTPTSVIGELSAATRDDDLLSAAAALVLQASDQLTTCEVSDRIDEPLDYGLDRGESEGIWLANNLDADLFDTETGSPVLNKRGAGSPERGRAG
jgi:rRNA-processing protein FCF1